MKISDLVELLFLAAIWSAAFLLTRIAVPELGPVLLIELRVLLAGLAFLIVAIRLNLLAEVQKQFVPLLLLGCINLVIPLLLFAYAALYLPAGFNSILNATAPLFGTIIASTWLKEKLTVSQFCGLILGFAGVTILVGWTSMTLTLPVVLAIMAGLLASLLYAIAATYANRKLMGVSPLVISTGSLVSAAIVLLPFTPFFLPATFPSFKVILATLALAFVSTALGNLLYFRLIKKIGVGKALTVTYLVPVFAMVWGAIILQESITMSMVLGCSCILGGIAIAISR